MPAFRTDVIAELTLEIYHIGVISPRAAEHHLGDPLLCCKLAVLEDIAKLLALRSGCCRDVTVSARMYQAVFKEHSAGTEDKVGSAFDIAVVVEAAAGLSLIVVVRRCRSCPDVR